MNYAIYSTSSGQILRTVSCPEDHAEAQLSEGESLLADPSGLIRDSEHKVEGGAFVALPPPPAPTAEEIAALAQAATNRQARAYLDSTDWYVVRFAESGVAVPSEITTARAAARASIA
jgi:hypothetical protein